MLQPGDRVTGRNLTLQPDAGTVLRPFEGPQKVKAARLWVIEWDHGVPATSPEYLLTRLDRSPYKSQAFPLPCPN